MNGNSYIKRPIDKNNVIIRADDDISLEFKTTQANGLFLYAKGNVRDFILLKLQNGNIVFEVDLGTGKITEKIMECNSHTEWQKIESQLGGLSFKFFRRATPS